MAHMAKVDFSRNAHEPVPQNILERIVRSSNFNELFAIMVENPTLVIDRPIQINYHFIDCIENALIQIGLKDKEIAQILRDREQEDPNRYKLSEDLEDRYIVCAIDILNHLVTGVRPIEKVSYYGNLLLGILNHDKHKATGKVVDLKMSIISRMKAIDFGLNSEEITACHRSNLALMLLKLAKFENPITNIKQAIDQFKSAVARSGDDLIAQYNRYWDLGDACQTLYTQSQEPEDLNQAIGSYERALQLCSPETDDYPKILASVGAVYAQRAKDRQTNDDANRSIDCLKQAVYHTQADSPNIMAIRFNLANALMVKADKSRDYTHLSEVLYLFKEWGLEDLQKSPYPFVKYLNYIVEVFVGRIEKVMEERHEAKDDSLLHDILLYCNALHETVSADNLHKPYFDSIRGYLKDLLSRRNNADGKLPVYSRNELGHFCSVAVGGTTQCQECEQKTEFTIWVVVNQKERPDLIDTLKTGDLNDFDCRRCGKQNHMHMPLMVYMPDCEEKFVFSPTEGEDFELTHEKQFYSVIDVLKKYLGDRFKAEWFPRSYQTVLRGNLYRVITIYTRVNINNASYQEIESQFLNMVMAEPWEGTKEYLLTHPEALSDSMERFLTVQIESAASKQDSDFRDIAYVYLMVLRRCRDLGVEKGIALCPNDVNFNIEYEIDYVLKAIYTKTFSGTKETQLLYLQEILEIIEKEDNPEQWCNAQILYAQILSLGEDSLSLHAEDILFHYGQALTVLTLDTFPTQWARVALICAELYGNRNRGDRMENVEKAISLLDGIEDIYTKREFPERWGEVQLRYGILYGSLGELTGQDHSVHVLERLRKALEVLTKEKSPVLWGTIQLNLCNYLKPDSTFDFDNRARGSIEAYHKATSVFTREDYPVQWAILTHNMGEVYNLPKGETTNKHVDRCIPFFMDALEVLTFEEHPYYWASTHLSLAAAYLKYCPRAMSQVEKAIEHYSQALKVFTFEKYPFEYLNIMRAMGDAWYDECHWEKALQYFEKAFQAISGMLHLLWHERSHRHMLIGNWHIFTLAAFCLYKLKRYHDAISVLNRGKAILFSRVYSLEAIDSLSTPSTREKAAVRMLNMDIDRLEREFRALHPSTEMLTRENVSAKLKEKKRELQRILNEVQLKSPFPLSDQMNIEEYFALIPSDGAMVMIIPTDKECVAFVLHSGAKNVGEEHIVRFNQDKIKRLSYNINDGDGFDLIGKFQCQNTKLDQWKNTVDTLGEMLWDVIMGPIHAKLMSLGIRYGETVLFIQEGSWALFPLNSAWTAEDNRRKYFLDDFAFATLPNFQILKEVRKRIEKLSACGNRLLSLVNSTGDLPFSELEGIAIKSVNADFSELRRRNEVTEELFNESLGDKHYFHFAGHGHYDMNEPLNSGIVLHDKRLFTLQDIISRIDFSSIRLVCLSACQSGLSEIFKLPNEHFGLPIGFLYAGAAAVVSSQWNVSDVAAGIIVKRFHDNLLNKGQPIPQALRNAQLWFRDSERIEISEYIRDEVEQLDLGNDRFQEIMDAISEEEWRKHPYYWAPFQVTGL